MNRDQADEPSVTRRPNTESVHLQKPTAVVPVLLAVHLEVTARLGEQDGPQGSQ